MFKSVAIAMEHMPLHADQTESVADSFAMVSCIFLIIVILFLG